MVSDNDNQLPILPEQYHVIGKVSEGGMGAIFKVRNRYTGGNFAVKVLRKECAYDDEMRQRFIGEAKSASSLKHPSICQVHDFGINKDVPYLVMDWIDGISLEKKIRRDGPLEQSEAVHIFLQIAQALALAHEHSVVHRDLKPENIMLARSGADGHTKVQIVDFGIAKVLTDDGDVIKSQGLTKTGVVLGTPLYMSPEQALGKRVDQRSDIYSFGCLMYAALSGTPPFVGETFVDTANKHISEAPPAINQALGVSTGLKMITLKAMEKKPEDRYQSMDEIITDLKKLTKGVQLDRVSLASERQRKRKIVITVAIFIVAFLLMYLAGGYLQDLLSNAP